MVIELYGTTIAGILDVVGMTCASPGRYNPVTGKE